MMSTTTSPIAERAATLVAGVFDEASAADHVAEQLRLQPGLHTVVIHPGDAKVGRKLEPEERGIWRTLLHSHAWFMPAGALAGSAVAGALVLTGWPAAAASPAFAVLFIAMMGAFFGGMFAGLLTLRPDRGMVIRKVHSALVGGRHAVIVHPLNEARARAAAAAIERAGATALRSL